MMNGLSPVRLSQPLDAAAQGHANFQAVTNTMSHTGVNGSQISDRISAVGVPWRRVAENVAVGQSNPQEVVRDWINSPGHRANLLDPNVTEIGVGLTGRYWSLAMAG